MSVVAIPFSQTDLNAVRRDATVRAMTAGQHVLAVLLTSIGVLRAIEDPGPVGLIVSAGCVLLVWHTVGSILVSRASAPGWAKWWLLGLAFIWLGAVAITPEFVWFAFLLWLLAGHLLPLRWGLLFSFAVFGGIVAAPLIHRGSVTYANFFGPLIGGVFAFAISRGYLRLLRDAQVREHLLSSLTKAHAEMAELQDELVLAQREAGAVTERMRIARDIHDTVAQALTSMRLLAHAEAGRQDLETAARTLTHLENLASDGLADVRRILAALVPAELEEDGLPAALSRMVERIDAETVVRVAFTADKNLPPLTTDSEIALLRTAQSALANVRQHSSANVANVTLSADGDTVRLAITDDGIGFDVAAWEREAERNPSSYGLRFMQSRLRDVGGELEITSSPDGTSVTVRVPTHFEQRPAR